MDPGYLFWSHKVAKTLQKLLDSLLFLLLGYTTTQGWNSQDNKKQKQAQVVRILWRSAYLDSDYHDLNNYFYVHESWLGLHEVLDKHPRLTLHGLNGDVVWFCDSGDRDLDVFDCKKFPFAWHAQNNNAQKFVLMSHQSMFQVNPCSMKVELEI